MLIGRNIKMNKADTVLPLKIIDVSNFTRVGIKKWNVSNYLRDIKTHAHNFVPDFLTIIYSSSHVYIYAINYNIEVT